MVNIKIVAQGSAGGPVAKILKLPMQGTQVQSQGIRELTNFHMPQLGVHVPQQDLTLLAK